MIKNTLFGLIIVTAVLFSLTNFSIELNSAAVFSLILGAAWLILEIRQQKSVVTIFFLFYLGLAIVDATNHLPMLILLVGVCANLAAWDLSRFRARIGDQGEGEARARLESKHLQRLLITTGAGFLIALVPAFVSLSLNFTSLAALTLVTLLILRASLMYLRRENKNAG